MKDWNLRYAINSKEEFNTAWGNDAAEQHHAQLTNHINHLADAMERGGVKEKHLEFFLNNYPKRVFYNTGHKVLYPECRHCEDEGR